MRHLLLAILLITACTAENKRQTEATARVFALRLYPGGSIASVVDDGRYDKAPFGNHYSLTGITGGGRAFHLILGCDTEGCHEVIAHCEEETRP